MAEIVDITISIDGHPYDPEEAADMQFVLFSFIGAFLTYDAPCVKQLVLNLIDRGYWLFGMDLTAVESIDIAAIGSLISCQRKLSEKGGEMVLIGSNEGGVLETIYGTGLNYLFHISLTIDEMESFLSEKYRPRAAA